MGTAWKGAGGQHFLSSREQTAVEVSGNDAAPAFIEQSAFDVPVPNGQENWGVAGQGLVEYALILVLVVLVAFVVVTFLGPWAGNVYSNIVSALAL